MTATNRFVALAALLLGLGCSRNEPADSPPAETSPKKSQAEGAAPQTEDELSTTPEQEEDVPGLAVGEEAPRFELKDQNGQSRSLAEILSSGNAALVFYRSADW